MQLTPAQMGMSLLLYGSLPMMPYDSRAEGIARGRQHLILTTREDFGYSPLAWHDYLVETNAGGYKWGNGHLSYRKAIESVLVDNDWQQAVAVAESECLLEELTERDARRRHEAQQADLYWSGKSRRCPKCNTEFKSVQDRGQCTKCAHVFYASHVGSAK